MEKPTAKTKFSNRFLNFISNNSKIFYPLFFIVLLSLIFCRAAFHSNYDSYNNIQEIPAFFEQEKVKEERNKIKVGKLKEYLSGYQSQVQNKTREILDPEKLYMRTNEVKRERLFWFNLYFIIDLFFMFLLSIVLFLTLKKTFILEGTKPYQLNRLGQVFLVLCGLAILFDLTENISMLSGVASIKFYCIVHYIKIATVVAVLLCWFKNFHSLYFKKFTYSLLRAMGACIVSLLIVILVLVLLTKMAQGITLVIDLFTSRTNSLLFLVLALFTSVLLSHFPVYLYIRMFESEIFQWIWSRRSFIPVIYYNRISSKEDSEQKDEANDPDLKVFNFLRHYLGTVFLLMILYAFIFSWNKTSYKIPSGIINEIFIIAAVLLALLQSHMLDLRSKIKYEKLTPDGITGFFKGFKFYEFVLAIGLLSFVGRLFLDDWDLPNKIYTSCQLIILILAYIMFRECRGMLKYKYGLSGRYQKCEYNYDFDKHKANGNVFDNKFINDGAELIDEAKYKTLWKDKKQWRLPILGNFSNNVYFLFAIALVGTIGAVVIICFALSDRISEINGANYLLVFLMLFYALFITIIKATFYGENKSGKNLYMHKKKNKIPLELETSVHTAFWGFPVKYTGFASVLLVMGLIFLFKAGNDLYLLKPMEYSSEELSNNSIDRETFLNRFQESSTSDTIYAISAFGGGLKANYNTLRTIDAIQDSTNGKFLNNTISMSGVSGGGLGLANYYLMNNYMQHDARSIKDNINKIGDLDIVSIDIPYFLFVDLWRSLIPNFDIIWKAMRKKGWDKDRSQIAMAKYKDIIAPDKDLDKIPYQKIHHEIYERGQHAPALLMNTTSTRLEYGVASSINLGEFPGAVDILNSPSLSKDSIFTLNFYDAVSTINRFPFLSPAAKIKNTGHFVDGGYFENSGILTSISFLDLVSDHQWSPDKKLDVNGDEKKVVIVNFLNSKVHWINYLLSDPKLSKQGLRVREKNASETSSVIKTVTGTEMLPNFFVEALKKKATRTDSTFDFITFYIPYKVTMDDVEQFLSADAKNASAVRDRLLVNNARIDSILIDSKEDHKYNYKQWGTVEPALARKLSTPDKIYQDIMIEKHPYILKQIDRIR